MPVKKPVKRRASTPKRKTTKRRKTRRKSGLSEAFSPAAARGGAKAVLSGAAGGAASKLLDKVMPGTVDPTMKEVIKMGIGFLTATVVKRPMVGAGISGAAAAQLLTNTGLLNEDFDLQEMPYARNMEALPPYLSEDEMYDLQEGLYQTEYIPDYM